MWEQVLYGKSLQLSAQFWCECKIVLKKSIKNIKWFKYSYKIELPVYNSFHSLIFEPGIMYKFWCL